MILVDANLLLYAYDSSAKQHEPAKKWLETAFAETDLIGIAWVTVLAFLRIGTNSAAFVHPMAIEEAVGIVDGWMQRPEVTFLEAGERHWQILKEILPDSQARGPLVMDAHLTALAIENGATLCTSDRDFSRFRGLKVEYPLG